ncbi:MAG: hypothetical protein K6E85_03885 [Lachnospiraceae bacterium]|nr:hypothetical protein [Lachnospiraceae bacterium]
MPNTEKSGNDNRKGKGEAGYISYMKKKELLFSIVLFAAAAGIFVLGLALNKWQKGNVFTIIAALLIIPMARFLTQFILLFPFRSVTDEEFTEVEKAAKGGSIIYADNVIASTEKAMQLSFIVITSNKILCLTGREKENALKCQEYLADVVKRRGYDHKVTVTDDRTKFFNLLKNSDSAAAIQFENDEARKAFDEERTALCKVLESVMV